MKNSVTASIVALVASVANATLLEAQYSESDKQGDNGDGYASPMRWTEPSTNIEYEYLLMFNEMDSELGDRYCQKFGARLASIHSAAEDAFIKTIDTHNREIWISGSDQWNEGTYVHWDGTPMDYFGWSAREPGQNQDVRDCIFLWRQEEADGWGDAGCGHGLPFLCKREPVARPVKGTGTVHVPGKVNMVKRIVPNTSGGGGSGGSEVDPDDDSIGTQLHIKVAWNSGITDLADTHLNSLEVQGGHHGEEATEEETLLTQVDAETESVPDGIQKMNLKIPYNLEMATHGIGSLEGLEAKPGHV